MKTNNWVILLIAIITTFELSAKEGRGFEREQVEPKGYLYGLGIGINQEIYKGKNNRFTPMPILGYRGDNFRILGPFISYDALKISDFSITLQAAHRFQGFDRSDSYIFENMTKRKLSMDAGIGLKYEKENLKIGVSSMFDVLSNSKGYESKVNLSKVYRTGPIFFEPSVSISFLDKNHVNYYYGVKKSEVNDNTYMYQTKSAMNTTIGISIATPILLGGFTQLALNYTWYDSSITNSPLVDSDANLNARVIFSKFF